MGGVNCSLEVELLPRPSKYGEWENDADFGEPAGDELEENCLRGSGRSFGNTPTPGDSETGISCAQFGGVPGGLVGVRFFLGGIGGDSKLLS